MRIAQKLYEGVDLGTETVGLISYMRTDSTRLSPVFVGETMEYIRNNYGENYVGNVKASKKKDNVQDAHEAIRPTSVKRTPDYLEAYIRWNELLVDHIDIISKFQSIHSLGISTRSSYSQRFHLFDQTSFRIAWRWFSEMLFSYDIFGYDDLRGI